MHSILKFISSLNLEFKIIIQGSFALKHYKFIKRNPNDIDVLFENKDKNILLSIEKWNKFISHFEIKEKIIDHDIFKKYTVILDKKTITIECLLTKILYKNLYHKYKNNVYVVSEEYAIITKFSQLSKLLVIDANRIDGSAIKKINNTLEDMKSILKYINIEEYIEKWKKILPKTIHLDINTWFFYYNENLNIFLKNFILFYDWLEKILPNKQTLYKTNKLYNNIIDFKWKIKIISSDIFIKNKNLLMSYLENYKLNKKEITIFSNNKFFKFDLNLDKKNTKNNYRFGNVINFENINTILLFVKDVIFVNHKNVKSKNINIILKLKRHQKWSCENLIISNQNLYKKFLSDNFIPFIEDETLNENEIAIPISIFENSAILNNVFLLINFMYSFLNYEHKENEMREI